jgi:IS605 OrfB family transposase
MLLRKVYRFRMRPTKAQEAALYRMAGARRFVYNWALDRRKSYYAEHGKGISAKQLSSDGERVPAPRFARKASRKLKEAQKGLSRKKPGSRRREKARHRVAKVHRKVSNQGSDFLHKLTTGLTRKYDCICVEDLSVKGLAKTKLSRAVLDAAFGEFVRQVEYKAAWTFGIASRSDASSRPRSCALSVGR